MSIYVKIMTGLIKRNIINLLIVIISVIFFLITIKEGHEWGGDFAHYINHAINIATGIPYSDTGYIFNPNSAWFGPITYPPVFPAILAMVYLVFGFDLYSMKVTILICYLIFLLNFIIYADKRISNNILKIFSLIMVAFSPLYWEYKNSVISDIPFLMFVFIVINLSDLIDNINANGRTAIFYSVIMGVLCYVCYGTRSVGLLAIMAFCINQLINRNKITTEAIVASLIFILLSFLQNELIHSDISYINAIDSDMETKVGNDNFDNIHLFFSYLIENLFYNVPQYIRVMKWYWEGGFNPGFAILLSILTGGMAIIGYIRLSIKRISIAEVFLAIYVLLLIFGPFFQGSRYLIPIFPMYVLFIFYLIDQLTIRKNNKVIISTLLISSIVLNYGVVYARIDYGPYETGVNTNTARELFKYIRHNTNEKSLVIFQKPRVMALYGNVNSTTYYYGEDEVLKSDKLEKYLKSINATHLVISNDYLDENESMEYINWIRYEQKYLFKKFENEKFSVYSR